jgi:hypothetical protein
VRIAVDEVCGLPCGHACTLGDDPAHPSAAARLTFLPPFVNFVSRAW